MSPTVPPEKTEQRDAEKVDAARQALSSGDLERAEALLTGAAQNAPDNYEYQYEENNTLFIKFWEQEEFLHYVMWQRVQGTERKVVWIRSAYPRAFYYLGFLKVQTEQYDDAIAFLDRGQQLEPTNPLFNIEKAHALLRLGNYQQSLALCAEIAAIGPHVSPHTLALALRGRGAALIEIGELDAAEEAFKESLTHEPGSSVALDELGYIEHLRVDGSRAPLSSVKTPAKEVSVGECACCGRQITRAHVAYVNGTASVVCRRCRNKLTKSWWQFWR
jgi:tetratricopeptide (TPR) repeat protein